LEHCQKVKAKKTIEFEKISLKKHILPYFEKKFLNDLTN
jgi:hypothetical protein